MKGRESGMPEQELWDTFFDPLKILSTLGLDDHINDVVEFGCGYGTFTFPTATIIQGKIFALDIEPEMIQITENEARKCQLKNIQVTQRDFMQSGSGLTANSIDYAMLFNILHIEHPEVLVGEANRVLRKGGRLGIIHWNYDSATPRGPSMAIRPKPEECIRLAKNAGFSSPKMHDLKPYHYGIVLTK